MNIHITDEEIKALEKASKKAIEKRDKNLFNKVFYYFKTRKLIKSHTALVSNYEATVTKRCTDSYRELEFIKETVTIKIGIICTAGSADWLRQTLGQAE